MVGDYGHPVRQTYGCLVCRKHVFCFIDIWRGILGLFQPEYETTVILDKTRTIYGRFAYLVTLMVGNELDVKSVAGAPKLGGLMHDQESPTTSRPETKVASPDCGCSGRSLTLL